VLLVRLADFQPVTPLSRPFEYWVKVNPEHHLGVRDLAGNPPWREVAPGVERD
jgi:hypothetical protein